MKVTLTLPVFVDLVHMIEHQARAIRDVASALHTLAPVDDAETLKRALDGTSQILHQNNLIEQWVLACGDEMKGPPREGVLLQ